MSGLKLQLPTLPGLPKVPGIRTVTPYKRRPLNIHKMLLQKIKAVKLPGKV